MLQPSTGTCGTHIGAELAAVPTFLVDQTFALATARDDLDDLDDLDDPVRFRRYWLAMEASWRSAGRG